MFDRAVPIAALLLISGLLLGCPVSPVGGLVEEDFVRISENGFDPQDNAIDINDYAWAMAYFQPDTKSEGHVYVGTGNDMIGLIYQGIRAVMGNEELGDIEARPPEIRRYRPDLGPQEWERVFDYRDVEPDPDFQTIGFRHMTAYRTMADGVNYLYAATMGANATVWRTASGDPGSWEVAWESGAVGSVRMMAEHNGVLYLGLANEVPSGEQLGKIWATDGDTFWPVMEDGFGDPNNIGVMFLISFADWLYAGTLNKVDGFEIWKLEGPDKGQSPIQLIEGGGPSAINESAITPCVFQGYLYVGSQLNPWSNISRGFKGADIIRIHENDEWETVVGPNSLSAFDSGFDHWPNTYVWAMTVHEGIMYASTYDQVSAFFNVLENLDLVIEALLPKRQANVLERWWDAGADLYKTEDGVHWAPVTLTGFGDAGNYGFRNLVSVGDSLYVGTTNPFDGLEVWVGVHSQNQPT